MRAFTLTLLVAAACGSKSPSPATPEPDPGGDEPVAEDPPAEDPGTPCDQYCADGCPEVEDYDGCMEDCGCGTSACDQGCWGACMSQSRPEEECNAECGCEE